MQDGTAAAIKFPGITIMVVNSANRVQPTLCAMHNLLPYVNIPDSPSTFVMIVFGSKAPSIRTLRGKPRRLQSNACTSMSWGKEGGKRGEGSEMEREKIREGNKEEVEGRDRRKE